MLKVSQEKFLKHRNALIAEVVEEMGEDQARRYFQEAANRSAIEDIARHRAFWEPNRDLSSERFRSQKWRKKRDDDTPEVV